MAALFLLSDARMADYEPMLPKLRSQPRMDDRAILIDTTFIKGDDLDEMHPWFMNLPMEGETVAPVETRKPPKRFATAGSGGAIGLFSSR